MASLHAIAPQQIDTDFSQRQFDNFKSVNGLNRQEQNKWTYLFASNIRFMTGLSHAIRIQKPNDDQLFAWLEKLVIADQCSMLFVEDFDLTDARSQNIKTLCETFGVTLVNLTIDNQVPDNLIIGPWH